MVEITILTTLLMEFCFAALSTDVFPFNTPFANATWSCTKNLYTISTDNPDQPIGDM